MVQVGRLSRRMGADLEARERTRIEFCPSMKRVLFVCIGNSCRSPVAEGFANYYGKGWLTAYSAGSHPAGFIMQNAIVAMREKGIDISRQTSKGLSAVNIDLMDWVIILEASLAHVIKLGSPQTQKLHWFIPDPVGKPLDVYRKVRDHIEVRVLDFIESVQKAS
jgi:arsenate reductase (thioredoxin)